MDKNTYEELLQTQDRGRTEEVGEDLFDEADKESRKSPERIAREKKFLELYEAYMRPEKPLTAYRRKYLLDDLYDELTKINRGWVFNQCAQYRQMGFHDAEPDEALFSGGYEVCRILEKDQETGNYSDYPVNHYLRISRNKIRDHYFRHKYGRLQPQNKDKFDQDGRKMPEEPKKWTKRSVEHPISLESRSADDNGVYREDRNKALAYDPFDDGRLPRPESDRKNIRLSTLYIRELMDYPNEPQKPLAAMYGSILFQMAKEMDGSKLAGIARKSTKLSSAAWAHQAMGNFSLEKLGDVSEKIVRRFFEQDLYWGRDFREYLTRQTDDGTGGIWGDIVYTATYTEEETSDWIASIFDSTMKKCARKIARDAQMREFAVDTFSSKNKLYKEIAKIEKKKEACR